jgi:hypothetical protein
MATKFLFTYNGYAYKLGNDYIGLPDPSLYVNDSYIPFLPAGNFQDISVYSTLMNGWEPSSGSASWITFSNKVNQGGNGWGSFRATAAANSTGNRTATITIKARYNNWAIDVSQNQVADSISLNTTFMSWNGATEEGVQKTNVVTSSGSWTASVTSDPGGIVTAYTASGSGSGSINITLNNALAKAAQYAQITYTRGTASTILDLCISGIISGTCAVP